MATSKINTSRQSALDLIEQLTIQLQAVRALADDPRKYYGKSPQRSLLRKHRQQLWGTK